MTIDNKLISKIAQKYALDIIYVFGSNAGAVAEYIRGEKPALKIPPGSDVDIGVKPIYSQKLSLGDKVNLSIAFEDILNVNRVDLVFLPEADPFLAVNVVRGERLFSRNEYRADEYELYILRRAGDLAPLEKERIALIMGD